MSFSDPRDVRETDVMRQLNHLVAKTGRAVCYEHSNDSKSHVHT